MLPQSFKLFLFLNMFFVCLFQLEWFPLVFLPVNRCFLHYIIRYWFLFVFLLELFYSSALVDFWNIFLCYTSLCCRSSPELTEHFYDYHLEFCFRQIAASPWFHVAFLRFYLILSFKNIPQNFLMVQLLDSTFQCRGHRFNIWSRKMKSHMPWGN